MTGPDEDPALSQFDDALAETQREERAERAADLERERRTDQRIVDALSRRDADGDGDA